MRHATYEQRGPDPVFWDTPSALFWDVRSLTRLSGLNSVRACRDCLAS
jgi:hypothetical protein